MNRYIRGSKQEIKETYNNATIEDIVSTLEVAISRAGEFVKNTDSLKGDNLYTSGKNVWSYIRNNIEYVEDGSIQATKSPGALFDSGRGDCKSMAVSACALMQKMGYDCYVKVVFYNPETPNNGHAYAVASDKQSEVVIDPVSGSFGTEDTYYKAIRIGAIPDRPQRVNFSIVLLIILLIIIRQ